MDTEERFEKVKQMTYASERDPKLSQLARRAASEGSEDLLIDIIKEIEYNSAIESTVLAVYKGVSADCVGRMLDEFDGNLYDSAKNKLRKVL